MKNNITHTHTHTNVCVVIRMSCHVSVPLDVFVTKMEERIICHNASVNGKVRKESIR